MSDLAPFVAAVIRDRVVSDLHDENSRLNNELSAAMAVIITGQGGRPVYASADFATGMSEEDSKFWSVRFGKDLADQQEEDFEENDGNSSDDNDCTAGILPLSRLGELEIFVGGILLCEMSQDYVEGFSSLDRRTGTVRFLELEVRKAWITLEIVEGSVSGEGLDLLRGASLGMLWRVLSGHVAATNPHAALRVQEVSLDTKYVPGMLSRVPPVDPRTEETQRQLAQTQRLLRVIVAQLRRNHPHLRGSNNNTLLAQGRNLLQRLHSQGIHQDSDPRLDAAIETLVREEGEGGTGAQGIQQHQPQTRQLRQGSNPNVFAVAR